MITKLFTTLLLSLLLSACQSGCKLSAGITNLSYLQLDPDGELIPAPEYVYVPSVSGTCSI